MFPSVSSFVQVDRICFVEWEQVIKHPFLLAQVRVLHARRVGCGSLTWDCWQHSGKRSQAVTEASCTAPTWKPPDGSFDGRLHVANNIEYWHKEISLL